MITLFKVSDIDFIQNSEDQEIFRFSPSSDVKKKIADYDLLKKIFYEDIEIFPEPTAIIEQLMKTQPQPQTENDIAQILKFYPYEVSSAIYDYKFRMWQKLGNGTITRNEEIYNFNNAAVQLNDFSDAMSYSDIEVRMTLKILSDNADGSILRFFNNLSSTTSSGTTSYPYIGLNYSKTSKKFTLSQRLKNNGNTQNSVENYDVQFPADSIVNIRFYINSDGTSYLIADGKYICDLNTKNSLNLKKIRVLAKASSTLSTTNDIEIQKFAIFDPQTISRWNKI